MITTDLDPHLGGLQEPPKRVQQARIAGHEGTADRKVRVRMWVKEKPDPPVDGGTKCPPRTWIKDQVKLPFLYKTWSRSTAATRPIDDEVLAAR